MGGPIEHNVNADVLWQVFSPFGPVARIVCFDSRAGHSGMQALVEFDGDNYPNKAPLAARDAFVALDGRNMYGAWRFSVSYLVECGSMGV